MSNDSEDPRQSLALVRTDLANERTLLAYGRTGLMITGTGVSLLKFFPELPLLLGWTLTGSGAIVFLVGAVRFARLRSNLRRNQ